MRQMVRETGCYKERGKTLFPWKDTDCHTQKYDAVLATERKMPGTAFRRDRTGPAGGPAAFPSGRRRVFRWPSTLPPRAPKGFARPARPHFPKQNMACITAGPFIFFFLSLQIIARFQNAFVRINWRKKLQTLSEDGVRRGDMH